MASADLGRGAASAAISLRWVYPKHLKEPLKLAMAYKQRHIMAYKQRHIMAYKQRHNGNSINKVIFTKS